MKLEKYLLPGWSAQSLSSKNFFRALSYLETLQSDLINILVTEHFPPKLMGLIWQEYKKHDLQNNALDIKSFSHLLKDAHQESSPLYEFIYYYSSRLILLYFLQLRLLKILHQKLDLHETMRELFSPPLALNKIFAKGTSRELKAKSLENNQYSWYRPSEIRLPQVYMLYNLSTDLSFPETLKLLHKLQRQKKPTHHSHAMSHLGMGLLINCLQVNLPKWHKNQMQTSETQHDDLRIHSALYSGDYLEELGVSYWLAQENNKTFSWDELICPHFTSGKEALAPFEFHFHELQQLQLLAEIHHHYSTPLLEFITTIYQQWQNNISSIHQADLLEEQDGITSKCYDQIILSALDLGKNNTHHILLQKIHQALTQLKDDRFLLVMSNQNFYLPSQSEKVANIFKFISPICTIDLTGIESKGETPNYIYIFRKKHGAETSYGQTCTSFTFRFTGQMTSFQNFCAVAEEINNFFQKFLHTAPAIFQSCPEPGTFSLDYFHSPIVNGVQIYSSDNSKQYITHPNFFKNLLKNTMPLTYYFDINHIDPKEIKNSPPQFSVDQFLPLNKSQAPGSWNNEDYLLILNLSDPYSPCAHLSSLEMIESKIQELGQSEYLYYRIRPLSKRLNINLFKTYVESKIGQQVLGITVANNKNQVRSKINTFLVPSFVLKSDDHGHKSASLDFSDVLKFIETFKSSIPNISNFTQQMLELSEFKKHTDLLLKKAEREAGNWKDFDFNTKDIITELNSMPLNDLYPNNNELNVTFHTHVDVLKKTIINQHEINIDSFWASLSLKSNNSPQVSIKGTPSQMVFLDFLLKKVPKMNALDILTLIKIPSASDCTKLIQLKSKQVDMLKSVQNDIHSLTEKLIHFGINQ